MPSPCTLTTTDENSTINDLKNSIKTLTQRDDNLKILHKFPLIELDTTDSFKKLKSAGLESSETLTIEAGDQIVLLTRGIAPPKQEQVPFIILREIPDDNSCLFNSIGYVLENRSMDKSQYLRDVVAEYILARPLQFTRAVLGGKGPSDYARWIRQKNTWGGAIELSIFSEIYGVEIGSFHVQTGRMDLFGEGRNLRNRVYLQYTGIHYEAFARTKSSDSPKCQDETIFPADDFVVMEQVKELVLVARAAHRFTDTAKFSIKCSDCQMGFNGQIEAQKHAESRGHFNFIEYK